MKTVEMEEQKHQKRKQPRTKPKKQVLYGVILYGIAESFSDNFAAVGNHHKRLGLYFFNIVSQLHSLASFHDGQYNIFLLSAVCSLRGKQRRTSPQFCVDKVTDRRGVFADNGEVFAQVDVFNGGINDNGFRKQAAQGKQTGGNIEHKAG